MAGEEKAAEQDKQHPDKWAKSPKRNVTMSEMSGRRASLGCLGPTLRLGHSMLGVHIVHFVQVGRLQLKAYRSAGPFLTNTSARTLVTTVAYWLSPRISTRCSPSGTRLVSQP